MTAWRNITVPVAVLGGVCLLVMGRQLVEPGVYSCIYEDTVYYINWTRQVADGLTSGLLYPRWVTDSHAGYGTPAFVFYPPLAVFSSSILLLVSGDLVHSAVIVKVAGMFFSGLFMYRFLCRLLPCRAALAGSALYMLMPYRIYEMYFLGVHASKLTYVWFPLVFYYLHDTLGPRRSGKSVVLLGVSFALLCLTHILYAYMTLFVMAAYALFMSSRKGRYSGIALSLSGVVLGLSLAGVYIIPAMAEQSNVHFDLLTTRDTFSYYNNFLFNIPGGGHSYWFYAYLSMTVVTTAGLCASILLAGWRGIEDTRKDMVFAFGLSFIFILFMMTSLSSAVWEYAPGMRTLGFPTRWSTPLVFCSSALAAAGVSGIARAEGRLPKVLPQLLLVAIFALWSGYYVYDAVSRGCLFTEGQIAGLPRDMEVPEYVPAGVSLDWLESERKKLDIPKVRPTEVSKNVKLNLKEWLPEERVIGFSGGEDAVIRLRTFYYPGWRAFRDGAELAVEPELESGAILIQAPAGDYDIRVVFTDTPLRSAALYVTLAGILASTVILISGKRKKQA